MDFVQSLFSVTSNRLGTTIQAAKVVLLTMGTISTLILFKAVIVPNTFSFIFSTFPPFLDSARSWLSVPFLYIIVNFIILSIAVSSNFHNKRQASPPQAPSNPNPKATDSTTSIITEDTVLENILQSDVTENIGKPREESKEDQQDEETLHDSALSSEKYIDINPPFVIDHCDNPREKMDEEQNPEDEISYSALSCTKSDMDRAVGKGTGDCLLPDSVENCDDMEATWKAIMEREGKQVTWKLKKSGTWGEKTRAEPMHESQVGEDDDDHIAWAQKELRKFDTFNDTASLKRDKSMSPEELYSQAEAFIKKINNQMRLQRLESEQKFMEMVARGVEYH